MFVLEYKTIPDSVFYCYTPMTRSGHEWTSDPNLAKKFNTEYAAEIRKSLIGFGKDVVVSPL